MAPSEVLAAATRRPLDAGRILDAAATLIETDGAASFSMRRLAAALDVTPMALYRWFDNREALLDALAARTFESFVLPDDVDGSWQERLLAIANSLRSGFVRSRALLPLVSERHQLEVIMVRATDRVLALLTEAGLTGPDAVDRCRAVLWSIIGFVFAIDATGSITRERADDLVATASMLGPDEVPAISASLEHFTPVQADELFALTLRLLIDGIAADASKA